MQSTVSEAPLMSSVVSPSLQSSPTDTARRHASEQESGRGGVGGGGGTVGGVGANGGNGGGGSGGGGGSDGGGGYGRRFAPSPRDGASGCHCGNALS